MSDLAKHHGQRLDKTVSALKDISRNHAAQLISEGNVQVNGELSKASYIVQKTDVLEITMSNTDSEASELRIEIIYEDKHVLAIDKPQGLLVHKKDNRNAESTVLDQVSKHVESGVERGGVVHRLDRDTSGIMVVAKTQIAFNELKNAFKSRNVQKVYTALVIGEPKDNEAIFKWPIARWPKHPALFRVDANGKPAETRMKIIKSKSQTSMVELKPKTGRTHQLRVHMAHYGHPIIGDRFYNPDFKEGQQLMLHARSISFELMNQEYDLSSPMPKRFEG